MTITTDTTYRLNSAAQVDFTVATIGVGPIQAVTSGLAFTYMDCSLGSSFAVALGATNAGGTAMEAIKPQPGQRINIYITQDSTGSRTVTWDSWIWPAKTAPTLSTTGSSVDLITGTWNETLQKWVGASSLNLG